MPSGQSGFSPLIDCQDASIALPASLVLSARTGFRRTVLGWLAVESVGTVVPSRSLIARLTPAPPTAAVLVTAAPSRPGKFVVSSRSATNAPRSAPTIGTYFLPWALIESTTQWSMPEVQMPWIPSYWPLAMKLSMSCVGVVGSQPVATPSLFGTTLMFG